MLCDFRLIFPRRPVACSAFDINTVTISYNFFLLLIFFYAIVGRSSFRVSQLHGSLLFKNDIKSLHVVDAGTSVSSSGRYVWCDCKLTQVIYSL